MQNLIFITDPTHRISWHKHLSHSELRSMNDLIEGRRSFHFLVATLIPIRTDSLENLSKDFFLPTVVNQAARVQHTTAKIFALMGALVLDAATFPLRLVTCLPRVIANSLQKEHPFHAYLKAQDVSQKLLNNGYVRVKISWERSDRRWWIERRDDSGQIQKDYPREVRSLETNVNFIEMPHYPHDDLYELSSLAKT